MRQRARRAQLGAGISAGVLGVAGLGTLLFAPLVRGCVVDVTFTSVCPPRGVRYVSLPQAGLGTDAWALLLGLFVVVVLGMAVALLDARHESLAGEVSRWGIPLWVATVVAVGVCAWAARGIVGLAYLPAVLALCLAASASLARRQPPRPTPTASPATADPAPSDTAATVPTDAASPTSPSAHDETRDE